MSKKIGKGILRIGNEEREIDIVEAEIDLNKVSGVGIDKLKHGSRT
jgi:hypothetical protein